MASRQTGTAGTFTHAIRRATNNPPCDLGLRGVAAAAVLVGLLLLGLQWIQYEAERRGINDARHEMRTIDSCASSIFDSSGYRPVHVERAIAGGRESYDGFIATCTDKRCALYDPLQHRTHVVPLDQVICFDTVPPEQVYWRGSLRG
ncbi:hypothetical protein [Burkholderia lata]|uniref:hypothetical protein n=1 Tax=Burkholderia lata (strain ATCC 17760 / DSM 23089 / LMG 22485 / NCIMB 9086 / R18194 / 383) TaxID=482957 RepID=UPI001583C1DF|nr:hypothetical protein [Burkholderia lata]